MKKFFCSGIFMCLGGCASTAFYQWGGYEEDLYRYYNKPQYAEAVLTRLEAHLSGLEANARIVPPGLYAELGTFYLERGDAKNAVRFYQKEAATWPESRPFMDAISRNLAGRIPEQEADDAP